jgi:hypothetical protein
VAFVVIVVVVDLYNLNKQNTFLQREKWCRYYRREKGKEVGKSKS